MAETKRYGLSGVSANLELGKGGARIKQTGGVVEVKNHADSAYAVVRGAAPVGPNDFVTKSYLESYGSPVAIGNIYDSGSTTPASAQFSSAAQEGYLAICNETVGAFTTGRLYKLVTWNSTVGGSTWTEITPYDGMKISMTVATTGGSPAYQADHLYLYDAGTTSWVDVGPTSAEGSTNKSERASFVFGSNATINIGDPVFANARAYKAIVHVTTPFDTAATLTIGDVSDVDRLCTAAEIDLNIAGIYVIDCYYNYSTSTQITATYTQNAATVGAATIEVLYTTE